MKLFRSDIRNAAQADLDSCAHARVYHEILERLTRTGEELEARSLASHYGLATELRHIFACADRVTAELGEVSR